LVVVTAGPLIGFVFYANLSNILDILTLIYKTITIKLVLKVYAEDKTDYRMKMLLNAIEISST